MEFKLLYPQWSHHCERQRNCLCKVAAIRHCECPLDPFISRGPSRGVSRFSLPFELEINEPLVRWWIGFVQPNTWALFSASSRLVGVFLSPSVRLVSHRANQIHHLTSGSFTSHSKGRENRETSGEGLGK